jgi:hypothetical protein
MAEIANKDCLSLLDLLGSTIKSNTVESLSINTFEQTFLNFYPFHCFMGTGRKNIFAYVKNNH